MERTYSVPCEVGQVSLGDVRGELSRVDDVGAASAVLLNISVTDEWVMLAVGAPEAIEKLIKEAQGIRMLTDSTERQSIQ